LYKAKNAYIWGLDDIFLELALQTTAQQLQDQGFQKISDNFFSYSTMINDFLSIRINITVRNDGTADESYEIKAEVIDELLLHRYDPTWSEIPREQCANDLIHALKSLECIKVNRSVPECNDFPVEFT